MLGLVYKCVRGQVDDEILKHFRIADPQSIVHHRTRTAEARHGKQLVDITAPSDLNVVSRSLFGLVRVVNLLPQGVVDSVSVKLFQPKLSNRWKFVQGQEQQLEDQLQPSCKSGCTHPPHLVQYRTPGSHTPFQVKAFIKAMAKVC